MRKNKFILKLNVIFMAITLVFLSSCSFGGDKFFYTPILAIPETLDSREVTSIDGKNIIINCYQGLMRVDENNNIVPGCALRYTHSPDFRRYTFYLNENCKWRLPKKKSKKLADILGEDYEKTFNTKVKADDFLFAVQRAVSPENTNPDVFFTYNIKNAKEIHQGKADISSLGVSTSLDNVITFELENPDENFLYKLTLPVFMPTNREFFEKSKGRYGLLPTLILSNGPYYVSDISEDKYVKIKKSETFKDYKVKNDGVTFVLDEEQNLYDEKLAERKGYTIAKIPVNTETKNLPSIKSIEINNAVKTLIFNPSNANLKDINFRKALFYATDKKAFAENINSFISKNTPITINKDYKSVDYKFIYDKNLAKTNYARSSIRGEKINLTVSCLKEDEQRAKMIIANWQEVVGINTSIKLETLDYNELFEKANSKTYDIIIFPIFAENKFADEILMSLHSNFKENFISIQSLEFDNLIYNASAQSNSSAKNEACNKAEKWIYDTGIFIPLENYKTLVEHRKSVKNIVVSRDGNFFFFPFAK
ncbi:MAG: ABC transporter substrate-binding protein [Clostridia bacterium]|nr:ABC transporter substrate-binding protein [Clostridia bacterium]